MKHLELLKLSIRLQRMVDKEGLNIYIDTHYHAQLGSWIRAVKKGNDNYLIINNEDSIYMMIQAIRDLNKDTYKLLSIDDDLFEIDVYLNKEVLVKVLEITKNGLLLSNGLLVSRKELWVKE